VYPFAAPWQRITGKAHVEEPWEAKFGSSVQLVATDFVFRLALPLNWQ